MLTLAKMAKAIGASYQGADAPFRGFSIDSRTIQPGECFVALQAARDGHDFMDDAIAKGAGAVVCRHPLPHFSVPVIQVEDTEWALGALAQVWRLQFSIPIIAITGSSGKTTVKTLTAAILRQTFETLMASRNLNNHLGLPVVLGELHKNHEVAVLELGARLPGEIRYLTKIAQPTIALVTLVNPCHIARFGTVEAIAKTKGELFENLAPGAIALINQEDIFNDVWKKMASHCQILTFSVDLPGDFYVRDLYLELHASRFELITPVGSILIRLPLSGRHNVQNAVAASALALQAGASLTDIQQGLAQAVPAERRLQLKILPQEVQLLDDSYNASPTTMSIALEILAQYPGEKAFFMGDMGELSPDNVEALHASMGEKAKQLGIQHLYCVGPLSANACEAFGRGAESFESQAHLLQRLPKLLSKSMTCLVKGSRSSKMDQVADAIVAWAEEGK
jgi:UDP-N-acetylmuramoyl-tripeptide--D-alanyl-D-alanine ligase